MGSFKLRLVTYFMLLSLLPLIAATWAFSEVARRGEAGSADARLSTALRVAAADHAEQVQEDAAAAANSLARATPVQRAFVSHNRSALVRISREVPHSAFYSGDDLLAGEEPGSRSVVREADVTTRGGEVIGTVVVSLPLDDELVRRLRSKAGLESADRFVLVAEGRVIAPHGFEGAVDVPSERPRYVTLRGETYRGIGTELVAGGSPVSLLGLTPKQFLLDCQIHLAKSELLSGEKELAQIAKDCGFAHQSHFTSRFKQSTGLTPTRWRRMASERYKASDN